MAQPGNIKTDLNTVLSARKDTADSLVKKSVGPNPPSPDGKWYFRSSMPNMNIVDNSGVRHTFGKEVPNWFFTSNKEVAEFIRTEFVGMKTCPVIVEELDAFTFDASTIIQPEILPILQEVERTPAVPSGFTSTPVGTELGGSFK